MSAPAGTPTKIVALITLSAVLLLAAATNVPTPQAIESAMLELALISGFSIRHPVVFEPITRDQVNQFLQQRIKESVKPEEIRAEELTLKKLGFVPKDFDLKKTTLALLTEQTAAFYDFHRKKLYITDWAAATIQDEALVHELAHALADQNFSLEKFSGKVENDSEKSLARQAVVEGQASWLMRQVLLRHGVNLDAAENNAPTPKQPTPEETFPIFDQAPLYFQQTLMFPYNEGEAFQKAVFEKYGKEGYTRVFHNPPVSAQQIIHPDLYFSGLVPLYPDVPEIKGMKRLVEGPLGELDHSILIQQYAGEQVAHEVSPHWRGAAYRIYENRKEKRDVLVYRSVWDSEASASLFFTLYQKVLHGKWKRMDVSSQLGLRVAGEGDDGYFCLDLSATVVTSREGLATPCPN
jgi:hypothetical protein